MVFYLPTPVHVGDAAATVVVVVAVVVVVVAVVVVGEGTAVHVTPTELQE